jgi:UDP-glucose 4-epimerase
MKTYFVTGGEGFVGHHICKELLRDPGNRVVSFDALKHFVPIDKSNWPFFQQYRVRNLQDPRLVRERGDVTSRGLLQQKLEEYKPEVIIHLAALPLEKSANTHSEEARHDIFDATLTLLDVVAKGLSFKIERLVHASSSMVYGDFKTNDSGETTPAREDQRCEPKDLYGAMKLCGETMVRTYSRRFDFPHVIVRPSAVYGPTDSNRRVTEIFALNSFRNQDLVLENGGQNKLDFTYVEDLAKGFVLAATSDRALGETFNLTRGEGRSIEDLADVILKLNPTSQSKKVVRDAVSFRPNRGALDISKARELLGYNPEHSLEAGMLKYLDFLRDTLFTRRG